jgi:aspartyl-tRNA(Asn)/glutamyl-tRNA(Gln) amidotransferase subunit C
VHPSDGCISNFGIRKSRKKNVNERRNLMANIISDETIEYVGILAKLELSDEEKEQAKKDMGDMLDYIDKLNELDTTSVEPMSHVFPLNNVFREDVVVNGDDSENILKNAPEEKDGSFAVPKTVD